MKRCVGAIDRTSGARLAPESGGISKSLGNSVVRTQRGSWRSYVRDGGDQLSIEDLVAAALLGQHRVDVGFVWDCGSTRLKLFARVEECRNEAGRIVGGFTGD